MLGRRGLSCLNFRQADCSHDNEETCIIIPQEDYLILLEKSAPYQIRGHLEASMNAPNNTLHRVNTPTGLGFSGGIS